MRLAKSSRADADVSGRCDMESVRILWLFLSARSIRMANLDHTIMADIICSGIVIAPAACNRGFRPHIQRLINRVKAWHDGSNHNSRAEENLSHRHADPEGVGP